MASLPDPLSYIDQIAADIQARQGGSQAQSPASATLDDQQTAQAYAGMVDKDIAGRSGPLQSGTGESGAPSFWTKFGQGVRDPFDAGAQLVSRGIGELPIDAITNPFSSSIRQAMGAPQLPTINESLDTLFRPLIDRGLLTSSKPASIDKAVSDQEAVYQAARSAAGQTGIDWARGAGNVVGTVPASIAAVAAAPEAAGIAGAGLATGLASGVLTPITDNKNDFWAQKGEQAAIGGATGAVVGPALSAVAKIAKPQVSAAVQYLMDRGIVPTMGQIAGRIPAAIEEKLTSIPLVGDLIKNAQRGSVEDFNRAAYNAALAPIGETSTAPIGRQGVAEVEQKLGDAYSDLLPQMRFTADPQIVSEISALHGLSSAMPPAQAQQFTSILKNKVLPRFSETGAMDGETFKGLESELGSLAKGYAGDASFDNRQLGSAIRELQATLRNGLSRSNPDLAPQLSAINQGWSMFSRIRDAASRIGAGEAEGGFGVFTPNQLQSSIRAGDISAGKGAFATGNASDLQALAEAGKSVIGSKYPDSGTAGRSMTGLLAGALLGHEVNPMIPIIGAAAAAPYTDAGRRIAAALLAGRRPGFAGSVAQGIRAAGPLLIPGATRAADEVVSP